MILEQPKEAFSNWEQFNEMQSNFLWPPDQQDAQLYEVIDDFDQFVNVVNLLKRDIQETSKRKNK